MIVDAKGNPLKAKADVGTPTSALPGNTPYMFPYNAANWSTQEMGDWMPWIRSPDSEINLYRDRMVARSRDLIRNDGWASGGIMRILDNTIGTHLRLSANPDYRALAIRSGVKAFDAVWADEFRRAAEALWRSYSEDVGHYNDVSRQMTIGQQFRLAMRHKLIDGESLAVTYWLPDQVGYGAADYATSLLLIDPDRLSNPFQMIDARHLRGGVEIDDNGAPVAYHIRKAEQNDWYLAIQANTWERVERYDEDGWQRVIHDFDRDRAGQHRGIGVFTPILSHAKMLAKYYGVELQAATIASIFGMFVKSPYDPAIVQDSLGGTDEDELPLYQSLRSQWAQERPALVGGVKIPTLFPGESIEGVNSQHPHGNFSEFAQEMLRTFAAAIGISSEQITQDWSKTNYSSARAALLESWKTLQRRKSEFCINFANPFYGCWLWEAMDKGELPLPSGAPDYIEAKTAYSRADWLGVERGWVDPVAEKKGAALGIEVGISTLKQECAEQSLDWEEVADQRKIEMEAFKERGLPPLSWADINAGDQGKGENHDPASPGYSRK